MSAIGGAGPIFVTANPPESAGAGKNDAKPAEGASSKVEGTVKTPHTSAQTVMVETDKFEDSQLDAFKRYLDQNGFQYQGKAYRALMERPSVSTSPHMYFDVRVIVIQSSEHATFDLESALIAAGIDSNAEDSPKDVTSKAMIGDRQGHDPVPGTWEGY